MKIFRTICCLFLIAVMMLHQTVYICGTMMECRSDASPQGRIERGCLRDSAGSCLAQCGEHEDQGGGTQRPCEDHPFDPDHANHHGVAGVPTPALQFDVVGMPIALLSMTPSTVACEQGLGLATKHSLGRRLSDPLSRSAILRI